MEWEIIIGRAVEPRDWSEDFSHDNGKYENFCRDCSREYYGHKRRFTCKECYQTHTVMEAVR